MVNPTPATVVLLGLAGLIQASASEHTHSAARRSLHQLFARQTIDPASVPAACQSQCQPILDDLNRCKFGTGPTCICNTKTENNFLACTNCKLGAGTTDATKAQDTIDLFVSVCSQGGYSLPSLTVSADLAVKTAVSSSSVAPSTTKATSTSSNNSSTPSNAAISLSAISGSAFGPVASIAGALAVLFAI